MKLNRNFLLKSFEKEHPLEENDLIKEYSHRDVFKAMYLAIFQTDINASKQEFAQLFMDELKKIKDENSED